MTLDKFTARVPKSAKATITERTLLIWYSIYSYIAEVGQTDRFDRDLEKKLKAAFGRWVSEATLQRHLRRMTAAGLLRAHRIIVQYSEFGRVWLPFRGLFHGDAPSAGAFIRYTLPGMTPTLEPTRQPQRANET